MKLGGKKLRVTHDLTRDAYVVYENPVWQRYLREQTLLVARRCVQHERQMMRIHAGGIALQFAFAWLQPSAWFCVFLNGAFVVGFTIQLIHDLRRYHKRVEEVRELEAG